MSDASLILLDRDGVINVDRPEHVVSVQDWIPIPGSLEAMARLCQAGVELAIVTNQSGIGRGLFDVDTLFAIHREMERRLRDLGAWVSALFFCPHHPDAGCTCRKPEPGLLLEAGRRFHTDLSQVAFVGDSERDIQAAQRAGAQAVLVRTGNGKATEARWRNDGGEAAATVFDDLAAFTDHWLAQRG